MKTITLLYPDETPNARILDDLTILSRDSVGPKAAGGAVGFDTGDAALAGLESQLTRRGIAVQDYDAGDGLPATSAIVTDGQALVLGAETFEFTVAAGAITAIDVTP